MNLLPFARRPFSDESKRQAIGNLLENSLPDRDFYVLVAGGIVLAILGIFLDSTAVLIASMIVAPLAYPILALGLGLAAGDWRLCVRTIGVLAVSVILAVAAAWLATLCFGQVRVDPVFTTFGSNLYIDTAIALVAGAIAAYGLIRSKVGGAMTGIGIAVSLMPPLVATGVGLFDPGSFVPSLTFVVFLLNVVGILIGSVAVFAGMGLRNIYAPR